MKEDSAVLLETFLHEVVATKRLETRYCYSLFVYGIVQTYPRCLETAAVERSPSLTHSGESRVLWTAGTIIGCMPANERRVHYHGNPGHHMD